MFKKETNVQKRNKISLETTTACTWAQKSLRVLFEKLNVK